MMVGVYELPWSILSTHLTGVVTVTEEEIISAMKLVSETVALVVTDSHWPNNDTEGYRERPYK